MRDNFKILLLLLVCISISGCAMNISFARGNATPTPTMQLSPILGHPVSDPGLDAMVKQTLDSINNYGWGDPSKHGTGIWINWYRNQPASHQNAGHDGQNDIRDYENMVWYEARHPGDTSLHAAIARLQPTIQSEWGRSTLPKGWVYFLYQRLAQYTNNDNYWTNTMKNWANTIYKGIDPAVGVAHSPIIQSTGDNSPTCSNGYRVDQTLENGLALVDAGTRFGHPEWSVAGANEVEVVTKQAFVQKYHLFARIICQGQIWDWEARGGEIGQETDALLKAGTYTHNTTYLSLAQQMLDAVANPATGLRDLKNGGIYFKLLLNTGTVDTSRKEMRQLHILQSVHEANAIFNNRYATLETDFIGVAKHSFFAPPVAGWMYELSNNWTLYKGKENWISMEASGIAMEAIQTILD